jgi:hypothetical protein
MYLEAIQWIFLPTIQCHCLYSTYIIFNIVPVKIKALCIMERVPHSMSTASILLFQPLFYWRFHHRKFKIYGFPDDTSPLEMD